MVRREVPAVAAGGAAAALVLSLIYFGSRELRDFDSALIGYAVATVFAAAAIAHRYTLWLTRPPTWRYFRAGWASFFSFANFRRYPRLVPAALWRDIFAQTFILRRSPLRWVAHLAISWGVVLSLLITVPLTFGWLRFTLAAPGLYEAWVLGVPLLRFPIGGAPGFVIFHALDLSAVLLVFGLAIALQRRVTDNGLLTGQRFGFDLMPLVLLFAVAATGLMLTASSAWWSGRFYWFISLLHQTVVVVWLLSLPFGKFFHLVQRPASVGVTLYQRVSEDRERESGAPGAACRRCERPLPSAQFVTDLEGTLRDLGQRYDLGGDRGILQRYCPTCKRLLRAEAYYAQQGRRFV